MRLIDRATVYTGDNYTAVDRSNLRCLLGLPDVSPATTGPDRAELAALRQFYWEPGYTMPEHCQVVIDNVKWRPVAGTFRPIRGATGMVNARQCDLVRAV